MHWSDGIRQRFGPGRSDALTCAVFAALIAAKGILLIALGPVFTPDSSGYVGIAQAILSGSDGLHDPGGAPDIFAFRIVGYPVFLAATMAIAGAAWPYVVVCVQSAVSLCAGFAVLRLAEELGLSRGVSLLAVCAYATSMQLTLDQCILTDSLNASFVVLAIALLLRGAPAGEPLSRRSAVLVGFFLGLAFLVREFMQMLIVLFLPALAVRLVIVAKTQRVQTLVACVLVLAVPLLTVAGYREWNGHRTGERFVTTGAQTGLLQALAKAAQTDPDFLSMDTPIDRVMRQHLRYYSFGEVLEVNGELVREGYHGIDIARMATARYIAAWRERPLSMLALFRTTVSESQTKLTVRAITAVCEIIQWKDLEPQCPDYRDVYRKLARTPLQMSAVEVVTFIVITIQNTLSIVLFTAFFLGVPILVIGDLRRNEGALDRNRALLLAVFWMVYCGWDFAYIFIHFEDRYLAPVIPLSIVGGLVVMQRLILRRSWLPRHDEGGNAEWRS